MNEFVDRFAPAATERSHRARHQRPDQGLAAMQTRIRRGGDRA